MKTHRANLWKEPASARFMKAPRVAFMIRVGGWMVSDAGLFRWTRYEFTAGGKTQNRYDWMKLWPKKRKA